MNLPPEWVELFAAHGIEAVHWSTLGNPRARDSEIMAWARGHQHIVFTHDLDLAAIVATTNAAGPSVLQMRTQDVLPRNPSGKSPLLTTPSGFGGASGLWVLKSSKKEKKPLDIDVIYAIT